MIGFAKIAGLSALLSFGLVAWTGPVPQANGKLFADRLPAADEPASAPVRIAVSAPAASTAGITVVVAGGKGDRLPVRSACGGQAWPYPPECVAEAGRKPVRMITVETREGENTSVLSRVVPAVASR